MKKTLVGVAPQGSTPPPAGTTSARPSAGSAGAEKAHPGSASSHPPAVGNAGMKRTLVGMAPVSTPPPAGTLSSTPPPDGRSSYPPPAGQGGMKRTLVGMAPVSTPPPTGTVQRGDGALGQGRTVLGLQSPMAGVPPKAGPAASPSGAPGGAGPPGLKKTIMGVAMPGIAPLAPGVAKEALHPGAPGGSSFGSDGKTMGVGPPGGGGHTVGVGFAPEVSPRHGERRRSSAPPPPPPSQSSATIAIGSGLLLASGAVAFAIFWRSPAPLRAEARVDSNGSDLLHVTCATCPDGTEVRAGDSKAQVTGRAADLVLVSPLKVGENLFSVAVDRPGSGRDETVQLIVQIGYRIRPDLSALDSDHPMLRIAIEGGPLASMEIDGKTLTLGGDGKGQYDVDVTAECTGLADDAKSIERAIPYSVVGSTGASEQGVVNVRVAVPPLHIDSPTPHTIIERDQFILAGRTGRGARLVAGAQTAVVAADGTFVRSIAAPALGENTIKLRATVPGQAPRMASVSVRRVEHLADEAKTFAANAPLPFADLAASVNRYVGQPVVLSGEIVESRSQGATNLALLDVQKGCSRPPCLARLVFAGEEPVARTDRVQVYGYVTRAISPGGDASGTVPEVEVAFAQKKQ
ncbi:MAG TPA: hypothetical protein VK540_32100 [Polyangiaceae bacterium]|nr:hypothetical protein [Polyangiaceae bacterium]